MTDQAGGFMAGQVLGLVGLTLALAGTHPEPRLLLQHLEAVEDVALAAVGPTAVSDAYLAGIRDTVGRARSILQRRLATAPVEDAGRA